MDVPTNSANKTFACDKCKALKIRCIRASIETTCAKCLKSGQSCMTSARAPPRRRRAKDPQTERVRLADLHSKVEQILHNLESPGTIARSSVSRSAPSDVSTHSSRGARDVTMAESEQGPHTSRSFSDNPHTSVEATVPLPDWATRLDLDASILGRLLERYRAMQHHFPFVTVSKDCSVGQMLDSRPYLLLAATANAATHCSDLQENLANELRDLFARQLFTENETSLDLLQGLLVHIAWTHYYMIPRSLQAYKYLQMAIGVLVDLGLDDNPTDIHHGRPDGYMRTEDFRTAIDRTSRVSDEAQRTSLGCFYLSSIMASSMNKPNTLEMTDDIFKRARALDEADEDVSNAPLLPLFKYQDILEDVRSSYRSVGKVDDPALLPTCALRMVGNLDIWWEELPRHSRVRGLYTNRYYAAKVRIYELGLLFHFGKSGRSRNRPPYDLESNLFKCVEAIKCYLDSFLAIDITTYNSLPAEEIFRLIINLFILYKLSAGSAEIPDWNVNLCRNVINLETYLTTIARRIRSARPPMESLQPERDEMYFVLPLIMESARDSYVLARDAPLLVPPGHRVHIDMSRSRREVSSKPAAKCPATGFWIDKALQLDREGDWRGISPSNSGQPSEQIIRNNALWNDLLAMADEMG